MRNTFPLRVFSMPLKKRHLNYLGNLPHRSEDDLDNIGHTILKLGLGESDIYLYGKLTAMILNIHV